MADETKPVKASGAADKTLNLLGSVAGIVGNLLLGPGSNIDLGEPFRLGAAYVRQDKESKALLDVLRGNPHTAPLVEAGQQLGQAGGLPGLISGGVQGAPQGQATQPLLDSVRTQPYVDIHSTEFPAKLAERGLGDLAQKVVFAQSQQKPGSDVDELLKMLQIKKAVNEPSWQEKSDDAFNKSLALLGIRDKNAKAGQFTKAEIQAQLQNNKTADTLVVKTQKDMDQIDGNLATINELKGKIDSGKWPSFDNATISKLGPVGQGIAQRLSPDSAELIKQLDTAKAIRRDASAYINRVSGTAASDKERPFLTGSLAGEFDTPEAAKKFLDGTANTLIYKRLVTVYNKALAVKDGNLGLVVAERLGVDAPSLAMFKKLKAAVDAGKDPAADPVLKNYMIRLGMTPVMEDKPVKAGPKPKY